MFDAVRDELRTTLDEIRAAGLHKPERVIGTPQSATVAVTAMGSQRGREGGESSPGEVLNFCANNYLGLADHPEVVAAAHEALDRWGYGLASVRFICGTQEVHKELEQRISGFLGQEDTILYSSCFDANGGVFETLLGPDDAVISDALNHASIIDGIRLSKARRYRYANRDMADLERQLKEAVEGGAGRTLIVTDGVFSMDGYVAPLDEICDLADRHGAMVMVDDSHAVGFVGPGGRGTPELHGVMDRVDIITGTLGKALGGASGGYVAARAEIVALLRQRSRPYLFSNSLAPVIAAASLKVLDLLESAGELRERLQANTALFRSRMTAEGFDVLPGDHAIAPVMIGDAAEAARMAELLLERGVYVIGFSYPVVPQGQARIRVQLSAAHSTEDVNRAVDAFVAARTAMTAEAGAAAAG
ncbi:glycine C-acetyltransferase [Streptomyces lydicus]|uniref:glycine C-acetyltransferase n=1 Tax=Streptomyces lydicus TaxID=47763 RepID=UPI00378F3568